MVVAVVVGPEVETGLVESTKNERIAEHVQAGVVEDVHDKTLLELGFVFEYETKPVLEVEPGPGHEPGHEPELDLDFESDLNLVVERDARGFVNNLASKDSVKDEMNAAAVNVTCLFFRKGLRYMARLAITLR